MAAGAAPRATRQPIDGADDAGHRSAAGADDAKGGGAPHSSVGKPSDAAQAGRVARDASPMRLDEPLSFIQDATQRALQVPERTLERLLNILEPAQRIFTYGRGRSGFVARAFAVRLMHLGYSTYVVGETITAPVQKDDVVICVSGSGTTYPVVMTAELGRRQGARVVAVTANPDSEVARLAHVTIPIIPPSGNGERSRFAPLGTIFETAAWLFCDVVVAMLMERKGETEAAMRERHATLE